MTLPFGARSKKLLSQAHPSLQLVFFEANKHWQCTILSAARTKDQQADLVNGTNITGINPERKILSHTMHSKHLIQADGYCHALDVAPDPVNFERKSYNLDLIYFAGYIKRLAEDLDVRLRYGGDWGRNNLISDESFQDLDHWELA